MKLLVLSVISAATLEKLAEKRTTLRDWFIHDQEGVTDRPTIAPPSWIRRAYSHAHFLLIIDCQQEIKMSVQNIEFTVTSA